MTDAHAALEEAISTFLHANNYMPQMFALQLTESPDAPEAQALRAALRAAIDGATLPPERFEFLTNAVVDTQAEVDGFLSAIWAYAYEDGPEPDLP